MSLTKAALSSSFLTAAGFSAPFFYFFFKSVLGGAFTSGFAIELSFLSNSNFYMAMLIMKSSCSVVDKGWVLSPKSSSYLIS